MRHTVMLLGRNREQLWRTLCFQPLLASKKPKYSFRCGEWHSQTWFSRKVREYASSSNVKDVGQGLPYVPGASPAWQSEGDQRKEQEKNGGRQVDLLVEVATAKNIHRGISEKAIDKELAWLKDPKQLAHRVSGLLSRGEPGKAAALVRKAQGSRMECAVAWNNLIQYSMDKGVPLAAFKFYNDMKKRGRRPNSRTYTIMLDGLGQQYKHPSLDPVQTALSIYRSISAPNSVVKANIIHSNAMLRVCASHSDMDTLWKIAAELSEKGPDAPGRVTYTIILQAIKAKAQRDVDRVDPSQVNRILEIRAASVRDGKRIWADIIRQWRTGYLMIDNFLVTTMASLLVNGASERDCYDTLALMNQTTGVPIFASKPLSASGRRTLSEQSAYEAKTRLPLFHAKNHEERDFKEEDSILIDYEKEQSKAPDSEQEESLENVFDPLVDIAKPKGPKAALLVPGNVNLTFILEACRLMTQAIDAAKQYWHHFTRGDHPHKIKPDAISFHQYLRVLRAGRSSKLTLEVVRDEMVPANKVEGKTFHIAISCCRRDRSNPNVFTIANQLLALMDLHLALPDPRALHGYLDLVDILAANPQWLMSLNGLWDMGTHHSSNMVVLGHELLFKFRTTALSQLRPHVTRLLAAINHGRITKSETRSRRPKKNNESAIAGYLALKALVRTRALVDSLLSCEFETLLSKSERHLLEAEAKELGVFSSPEMVAALENTTVSLSKLVFPEFKMLTSGEVESKRKIG